MLLEAPGRIAVSPDGHGGMLAALGPQRRPGRHPTAAASGTCSTSRSTIRWSTSAGRSSSAITCLSGSELSTQVVAKRDPLERVGNVVQVDGRLMVIEYSDLPDDAAAPAQPGRLAGDLGGQHRRPRDRRRASCSGWPAPADGPARSTSPARRWPASTRRAAGSSRQQPNAIKFERFIFDLMPQARKAIVVEVDRAAGVRPAEERPGAKSDTPETVRAQMAALHAQWLRQAGAEVADDVAVEISPLFALDAEELAAKIPPGTRITEADVLRRRIRPWPRSRWIGRGEPPHLRPHAATALWAIRPVTCRYLPPGPSAFSFSSSSVGRAGFLGMSSCSWPACSSFFSLACLGLLLLLHNLVAAEVDLAIDVVGDDVVPVGEAGVQLGDLLLAVGNLLVVLLLLPLVLLLDPLALGLAAFCRPAFLAPRLLVVGLLLLGLLRVGLLVRLLGFLLGRLLRRLARLLLVGRLLLGVFLASGSGSNCGLGITSGLNSAITNR